MPEYEEKLATAKTAYPFMLWEQSGLDQFSEETCNAFADIFDRLIVKLVHLGKNAADVAKLEAIHDAVIDLNALNEKGQNLIETDEREDLCELINSITVAAGLEPAQYGGGEGPASEWREW